MGTDRGGDRQGSIQFVSKTSFRLNNKNYYTPRGVWHSAADDETVDYSIVEPPTNEDSSWHLSISLYLPLGWLIQVRVSVVENWGHWICSSLEWLTGWHTRHWLCIRLPGFSAILGGHVRGITWRFWTSHWLRTAHLQECSSKTFVKLTFSNPHHKSSMVSKWPLRS